MIFFVEIRSRDLHVLPHSLTRGTHGDYCHRHSFCFFARTAIATATLAWLCARKQRSDPVTVTSSSPDHNTNPTTQELGDWGSQGENPTPSRRHPTPKAGDSFGSIAGKKGCTKIAGGDRCRDPRRPEREEPDQGTPREKPAVETTAKFFACSICRHPLPRIHRMPANDVLQLLRRLPPLELNGVQSVDQFKRFQAFVRKNEEEKEKRDEEEAELNTSLPIFLLPQTDLARICATRGEELDELGIVEEYDDDDDDDGDEHYVYGGLDMFEPATTDEEDANAQVDADDLYYLGVSDDENEEVGSDGGTDDDGGDDAGGDGGRAGPLRWDNLWDDDPPQ
uniref:Uncharacterized protein n=1 Tax=Oryza nivara TaxID=4536 RepID=A0A0E0GLZ4_ORYNI